MLYYQKAVYVRRADHVLPTTLKATVTASKVAATGGKEGTLCGGVEWVEWVWVPQKTTTPESWVLGCWSAHNSPSSSKLTPLGITIQDENIQHFC